MNNKNFDVITLFTDSTALPRELPELVNLNETWPYKLRNHFNNAYCNSVCLGGATAQQLSEQIPYHNLYKPNLVIVQAGLADCAPRALTRFEVELINRIPFLSKKLSQRIRNNAPQIRSRRDIRYTSTKHFEYLVDLFQDNFDGEFFWIEIIPALFNYEKIVPGVTRNIAVYNKILSDKLGNRVISLKGMTRKHIMRDNTHLNVDGHEFVFKRIMDKLQADVS